MLSNVSIVIPLAPDEVQHEALLNDLQQTNAEIILSLESSRATSLNAGAQKAKNDMLWFLHADSRVSIKNIERLDKAVVAQPSTLHYFNLSFQQGGLAQINAIGANIRSCLFKLPYGDQGFCLSKKQFEIIGSYPENTPYGEDVLFVRKAKKLGVKISPVRSKLLTSARKYKSQGWLRTTLRHQHCLYKLMRQEI